MMGVELPINTIIIIVLVIVVLLAIISFFYMTYNPSRLGMNEEAAKTMSCQILTSSSCSQNPSSITISNFDANKDGNLNPGIEIIGFDIWDSSNCGLGASSGDNLATFCLCHYNKGNAAECGNFCGCLNVVPISGGMSPMDIPCTRDSECISGHCDIINGNCV